MILGHLQSLSLSIPSPSSPLSLSLPPQAWVWWHLPLFQKQVVFSELKSSLLYLAGSRKAREPGLLSETLS